MKINFQVCILFIQTTDYLCYIHASLISVLPAPQEFTYANILIQDTTPDLTPIYILKQENQTSINFKDWIDAEKFEQQWRFRIKEMEVFLLDGNDEVITR